MRAKMPAEMEANFEPHFQEAARLYAEDTDAQGPNASPRECWPSTRGFERQCSVLGGATAGKPAHILIASQTLICVCLPRSSSLLPLLVCRDSQGRAAYFIFKQCHIDTSGSTSKIRRNQ